MVGAGPTGVEMASAIAVMTQTTFRKDFRRIDPKSAHIVLADMVRALLPAFQRSYPKPRPLYIVLALTSAGTRPPLHPLDV